MVGARSGNPLRGVVAIALLVGLVATGARSLAPTPRHGARAARPEPSSHETEGESRTVRIVTSEGDVVGESPALPSFSTDCRHLAFAVRGRVYVHDRERGVETLASVSTASAVADRPSSFPSLSGDGRMLAFGSWAENLAPGRKQHRFEAYLRDLDTGETIRLPGSDGPPLMSRNGRAAVFPSSSPGRDGSNDPGRGLYLFDLRAWRSEPVSVSVSGQVEATTSVATMSHDGMLVAFASASPRLVAGDTNGFQDIFIRDRRAGTTTRAIRGQTGEPDGHSDLPSLDSTGRWLAFASEASNLVAQDANDARDVFVLDRSTGRTTRISVGHDGSEPDGQSDFPSISGDGRLVAFTSRATNLVPGDTNGMPDVFVHDRARRRTTRVSVTSHGGQANEESGNFGATISADGRCVGFESYASNLVEGDRNGRADFFLHELPAAPRRLRARDPLGAKNSTQQAPRR